MKNIKTCSAADLFSANRKWVSAIEVLAAIKDRHLSIEDLLLVGFHHRLHDFSTKNAINVTKYFHNTQAVIIFLTSAHKTKTV